MTSSYRGMDRAALDLAYNNVQAEPGYQPKMERFKEQSDTFYRSVTAKRDIAYGERPRQRFDWLSCGQAAAPTFVFIHGGYWQNYTKEDLAFVAKGPLARGFNVALAEYTLAPEATMTEIVGEIGLLLDFLQAHEGEAGFGGRPVCLCGHSAGGQLAALHRGHPAVTLTLMISAIFDLEPIALSWLNEKLGLTREEVVRYSPILQIASGAPTIVSVGEAELPELIRQSNDYAATAKGQEKSFTFLALSGRTHFSILDDLADPNGIHMTVVATAIASYQTDRHGRCALEEKRSTCASKAL
jgi:pimeloyl-ACP methyl ester carboxylesterase